jgi:hypothetical protein
MSTIDSELFLRNQVESALYCYYKYLGFSPIFILARLGNISAKKMLENLYIKTHRYGKKDYDGVEAFLNFLFTDPSEIGSLNM